MFDLNASGSSVMAGPAANCLAVDVRSLRMLATVALDAVRPVIIMVRCAVTTQLVGSSLHCASIAFSFAVSCLPSISS